jgi:hypothetical protein
MPVLSTGTRRRVSPLLAVLVVAALIVTLPASPFRPDAASGADEPIPSEPELPVGALLEAEDGDILHALEDQGLDLAHWREQTPEGRVRRIAFVLPSQLPLLDAMGVDVVLTEALPTQEEVASQRMGNIDGFEFTQRVKRGVGRGSNAAGKPPVLDESGDLRVLRADTFTNYAGDFLSVEARATGFTSLPNVLRVDAPSSAAGPYGMSGAAFGPAFGVSGVSGPVAVVDAGGDNPSQGCGPLIDFPAGAVALADRGGCPFTEIVGNAQAAGASAVIVANNVAGAPINLGGTDATVTISSGMISLSDADRLKAGLPATVTIRAASQAPVVLSYQIEGIDYSRNLTAFNDAGQYIYHRIPRAALVPGVPEEVTVTWGDEEVTVPTQPWASYDELGYPEGFDWGFITTGYPDAVDSTTRIEELAAEFPDLAEIIELPHQSHGYRRQAMRTLGATTTTAVGVRSHLDGHEGGNDISIAVVNPGAADQPLTIQVVGSDITVLQSTSGTGALTGTAAQIAAAINADPAASALVHAHTVRGNAGNGVTPAVARANLSDFLSAPGDKISRDPQTVKAIRIGAQRDGSKVGVFAYSQEHAREWVTPIVALEAAERLLRNYGTDPETTRFVDELDIFIIPTVNPDGTNYSLYDFAAQRRNLNNHCPDSQRDAALRNQWGVDLNRNFRVGTLWDGYDGASTNCQSDVFAGPGPLSETEVQNEIWLIDNHPNIRFSMNIHTFGGYFMWAPGAYQLPGRDPLPRPSVGVEEYFFEASDTILGRIAEHRGTVVEPGRTGPIIDVLYSAAGNSADDIWYSSVDRGKPIFAWNFEAGADRYTGGGATGWQSPGNFFPNFAEGFEQAMEFATGVYGLLEVAYEFSNDTTAPSSTVNVTNGGWYAGAVDVEFTTSEPATVYYTTDGSRPTFGSPVVERRDARDGAAPVRVDATTTLRWFAVDAAGNIEGGYDPDGRGHNYRRVEIRIR